MTLLNTAALIEATRLVDAAWLTTGTPEERTASRKLHGQRTGELEAQWRAWLADEYASDLSSVAQSLIYTKAWEDGHSSGYNDVEHYYSEHADFARQVIAAQ